MRVGQQGMVRNGNPVASDARGEVVADYFVKVQWRRSLKQQQQPESEEALGETHPFTPLHLDARCLDVLLI